MYAPKGKAISYSEIKILEYWINIGADSYSRVFDHVKYGHRDYCK